MTRYTHRRLLWKYSWHLKDWATSYPSSIESRWTWRRCCCALSRTSSASTSHSDPAKNSWMRAADATMLSTELTSCRTLCFKGECVSVIDSVPKPNVLTSCLHKWMLFKAATLLNWILIGSNLTRYKNSASHAKCMGDLTPIWYTSME